MRFFNLILAAHWQQRKSLWHFFLLRLSGHTCKLARPYWTLKVTIRCLYTISSHFICKKCWFTDRLYVVWHRFSSFANIYRSIYLHQTITFWLFWPNFTCTAKQSLHQSFPWNLEVLKSIDHVWSYHCMQTENGLLNLSISTTHTSLKFSYSSMTFNFQVCIHIYYNIFPLIVL